MIPQKKFNEFTDMVNDMLENRCPYNLDILEQEAKKISSVSYRDSKMALGMIESLKYNAAGVDREFGAALKSSGGDRLVYSNYASACINMANGTKTNEIISEGLVKHEHDPIYLQEAIALYLKTYDVDSAEGCLNKLLKLAPEFPKSKIESIEESIMAIKSIYSNNQLVWKNVAERLSFIHGQVTERAGTFVALTESLSEFGVYYEFHIQDNIENVMSIESSVQDEIANMEYSAVDSAVSFSCINI